ncbi:hypothetical protein V5735_18070 (plasmid) [Haladaptatus sp. SPP-AMP-3]|uniref:hypothetical protein n=1 Tax=Haladaptatus sp. SPP-AMP-3 TaxID=3121295 RepID=UPI003C2D4C34
MTRDKHGRWRPRRPRIDPADSRRGITEREMVDQLRAEIESLRRRLAEAEEQVEALEAERERRERVVRACSMCGRVCTRPGPGARCPYCKNGQLERI